MLNLKDYCYLLRLFNYSITRWGGKIRTFSNNFID